MRNISAFDAWSFVHAISGAAIGALDIPRPWAWALLIGFEVIEQRVFSTQPESMINQVADAAIGIAAYEVIDYLLPPA